MGEVARVLCTRSFQLPFGHDLVEIRGNDVVDLVERQHDIILEYNARVEGLTTNEVITSLLEETPFQAGATPKTLHQTSSS